MQSDQRNQNLLITIDGPAGAGKTTVSRNLAKRLGYRYIDTGALYRGIAFEVLSKGVAPDDDAALKQLCEGLKLKFVLNGGELRLLSGDMDITEKIRTPEVTMTASKVSARPVVREHLLHIQRKLGAEKQAVFEGRDMGTVVFPEADIKFFLTAAQQTRAMRRYCELSPKSCQSLEQVAQDIRIRDENDSSRNLAPLKAAPDAIKIDSTDLSISDVVERMLSFIVQKGGS